VDNDQRKRRKTLNDCSVFNLEGTARFLKRCSGKFEVDDRIPQPVEWRWWDL